MVDVTHTPSPTAITKADEIVAVYRYDIHPVTVPRIATAIALALDEATARERERCRKIAADHAQRAITNPGRAEALLIEAAIRTPTEEPSK